MVGFPDNHRKNVNLDITNKAWQMIPSAPRFPILGRKIRFGLVGCGRISVKHIEALHNHSERAELVAVCDTHPGRMKTGGSLSGAAMCSDYREILENPDIDVVVLSTPSGLHAQQTVDAAAAGKHVITEKPMATRWKDGLRMVEACDKAGTHLFVVKQNRRNATLQLLKRAIRNKRFGKICMVNINVFWARPQEYYDQDSWRGTWEFDGGALMNQASHYIDLVDWLIGPVESVQCYTATLLRDIEVEDTGVLSIRWRSGALGSVNVTMLTYPRNLEGSISILGEKGTVRIGGVAVNEIQQWEFETPAPEDANIVDASYQTTSVYGFGHTSYYDNVLKTLAGEAEPDTDGREGLRALEVLIASYLSARDGRRVSLPLEY